MLLCFDVESTGTSVTNDRIVQAFVGLLGPDGEWLPNRTREWLIDPGVPVPDGAAAVHGITTERVQAEGRKDTAAAIDEIARLIEAATADGTPLVAYNTPFDGTMLRSELERYGLKPLDWSKIAVFDAFVADKQLAPFRKGKRTLTTIAPLYGVSTDGDAHSAAFDCKMTGQVAYAQLKTFAQKGITLADLQTLQPKWKAAQSRSLQAYFRKTDPEASVDPGFPLQAGSAA